MPANETRCFATRRLSPFQGTQQVIEAGEAQASSSNGIDWRILVRLPNTPEQAGNMNQQIILFGFWSSEGGFHRVPLPPLIDSRQIEIAAQPIIDVLLHKTGDVPFRQIDNCELWLLDESDLSPLALIAACSDPQQRTAIHYPEWQATLPADHSFTRTWSKGRDDKPDYGPRDELNGLIQQSAGQNPRAQWFLRQADGSGKGMDGINLDDRLKQRVLNKDAFPELLLRQDWPDKAAQQLVNDYLTWQAHFLLTLPHLTPITRKRLEQQAFKHPFKVEGQYKLWPEVIDREKLKSVLIEAQMRRSNPNAGEDD